MSDKYVDSSTPSLVEILPLDCQDKVQTSRPKINDVDIEKFPTND